MVTTHHWNNKMCSSHLVVFIFLWQDSPADDVVVLVLLRKDSAASYLGILVFIADAVPVPVAALVIVLRGKVSLIDLIVLKM